MSNRISVAEVSSLTKIGGGGFVIVSADIKRPKWRAHPWRTQAAWNVGLKRWEVRMYPGFVNGEDPSCYGYLEGDDLAKRLQPRELDLFDIPWMVLGGWRRIDGYGEPIPKFFVDRGVRKAVDISITGGGGVVIDGTADAAPDASLPPLRGLWAVDYWVSKARATYQMNVAVTGNLVTGQIVDYQVGFDTTTLDALGARPRLQSGTMPVRQRITFQDRLSGVFQDESEDRQKICTVYLLSPPEKVDQQPDDSFRPYVRHWCRWNLMHAAKNDPPARPRQNLVGSGLAAFVGRYTVAPQATLGAMEAEQQRRLAALLNSTSNEGKYWSI